MEKELMLEGMKCDGCVATVKTNQDISEVTFNEALSGTKFKVTGSK